MYIFRALCFMFILSVAGGALAQEDTFPPDPTGAVSAEGVYTPMAARDLADAFVGVTSLAADDRVVRWSGMPRYQWTWRTMGVDVLDIFGMVWVLCAVAAVIADLVGMMSIAFRHVLYLIRIMCIVGCSVRQVFNLIRVVLVIGSSVG